MTKVKTESKNKRWLLSLLHKRECKALSPQQQVWFLLQPNKQEADISMHCKVQWLRMKPKKYPFAQVFTVFFSLLMLSF